MNSDIAALYLYLIAFGAPLYYISDLLYFIKYCNSSLKFYSLSLYIMTRWVSGALDPEISSSAHLVMLLHQWKGLYMFVNAVLLLRYYEMQAYVKYLVCYFLQGCILQTCSFSWLLLTTGPLDVRCRIQLSWNLVLCCYLLLNVELLSIPYGFFCHLIFESVKL